MMQNPIILKVLYGLRKVARTLGIIPKPLSVDTSQVEYFDEDANDLVYEMLSSGKPCMISKFGTVELSSVVSHMLTDKKISFSIIKDFFIKDLSISTVYSDKLLKSNAGFFPNTIEYCDRFKDLILSITPEIDILASYITKERYINDHLKNNCKKINLEGYYAPFLWKRPWTRVLENKKVLVIHPFTESIQYQYDNNREKLFDNPLVLPRFKELYLIKAVQSLGGENDEFKDWFEALDSMKRQIDAIDFDIALIGCGAYGMPLAAYVKQKGKQAVHLAGWTQMLFGVYGERWIRDQPEFSNIINKHWIRPNKNETPVSAFNVEKGCYW